MRPYPWGVSLAWSGLAAGSVGTKPRLGALLILMVSAGNTDTCGDTHTHTYTHKVLCANLDPPLLRAQTGTEAREVVRHLMPLSPSQGTCTVPLKKSQPLPHQLVQQKTNEHKQTILWESKLRSRAAPGGMQAEWGRASLAWDHSKADLVPVLQQGLDLGGANPQPLLQQLLPGHIHPVPV